MWKKSVRLWVKNVVSLLIFSQKRAEKCSEFGLKLLQAYLGPKKRRKIDNFFTKLGSLAFTFSFYRCKSKIASFSSERDWTSDARLRGEHPNQSATEHHKVRGKRQAYVGETPPSTCSCIAARWLVKEVREQSGRMGTRACLSVLFIAVVCWARKRSTQRAPPRLWILYSLLFSHFLAAECARTHKHATAMHSTPGYRGIAHRVLR